MRCFVVGRRRSRVNSSRGVSALANPGADRVRVGFESSAGTQGRKELSPVGLSVLSLDPYFARGVSRCVVWGRRHTQGRHNPVEGRHTWWQMSSGGWSGQGHLRSAHAGGRSASGRNQSCRIQVWSRIGRSVGGQRFYASMSKACRLHWFCRVLSSAGESREKREEGNVSSFGSSRAEFWCARPN
jgi:hypothetical protein